MTAQSLAQEPELNHHAGSKCLVGYLVTEPHNELADAESIDYFLLLQIVVVGGLEQRLGRFWNVMQYFIVKFVMN